MPDRYPNYAMLASCEDEEADFRVRFRPGSTPVAVMAPHGGGIEAGTSELADAVAGRDHAFYAFEGIRSSENADLHLTSTRFDEPRALQIVARAEIVLAIHGRDGADEVIGLGGLHVELGDCLAAALGRAGFQVARHTEPGYAGTDPDNICNRGVSGRGVQLEIPRGLRRHLFAALNAQGRRARSCRFRALKNALRSGVRAWLRAREA